MKPADPSDTRGFRCGDNWAPPGSWEMPGGMPGGMPLPVAEALLGTSGQGRSLA